MNALDVLSRLRSVGAKVTIVGDRLHCEAPKGALTEELLSALRASKWKLIELLAKEASAPGSSPHLVVSGAACLYPALNQAVTTPLGTGRLWQVFSSRVGVVLDADPTRVVFFVVPDHVQPLGGVNDGVQASSAGADSKSGVDHDLPGVKESAVRRANQLTFLSE